MGIGGAVRFGHWLWELGSGRQKQRVLSRCWYITTTKCTGRRTLLEAEAFAARSYRGSRSQVRWVHCATSEADTDRFRTCEQARNDRALQMNIIPERMAAGIRPSRRSTATLSGSPFRHTRSFCLPGYGRWPRCGESPNI